MIPSCACAPRSYFGSIIRHLQQFGFSHLALVQTDTTQTPYFEPVEYARRTAIFLGLPNKAFILQLNYHESVGLLEPGAYKCFWDIDLYVEFIPDFAARLYQDYLEECWRKNCSLPQQDWQVPDHTALTEIPGLSTDGWSYHEKEQFHRRLSYTPSPDRSPYPLEIAQCFKELPERLLPILAEQFRELQVTSFGPHYLFPEAEPLFWKQFPLKRLRGTYRTIYGRFIAAYTPVKNSS